MKLSIVIPVYNEADNIVTSLQRLQACRQQGHEVIVVDGGSQDGTLSLAQGMADQIFSSEPGRAKQMNAGARQATGELLIFLHADTQLPDNAPALMLEALNSKTHWGRFNVTLSGSHFLFRIIENMMNWRSCLTGIATGDQVIFVKRKIFEQAGAYPSIKLMEDIALSKQLKFFSKPACIKTRVITSSRRWQEKGLLRTMVLMWQLRFLYFIGVSPDKLVLKYYR